MTAITPRCTTSSRLTPEVGKQLRQAGAHAALKRLTALALRIHEAFRLVLPAVIVVRVARQDLLARPSFPAPEVHFVEGRQRQRLAARHQQRAAARALQTAAHHAVETLVPQRRAGAPHLCFAECTERHVGSAVIADARLASRLAVANQGDAHTTTVSRNADVAPQVDRRIRHGIACAPLAEPHQHGGRAHHGRHHPGQAQDGIGELAGGVRPAHHPHRQ